MLHNRFHALPVANCHNDEYAFKHEITQAVPSLVGQQNTVQIRPEIRGIGRTARRIRRVVFGILRDELCHILEIGPAPASLLKCGCSHIRVPERLILNDIVHIGRLEGELAAHNPVKERHKDFQQPELQGEMAENPAYVGEIFQNSGIVPSSEQSVYHHQHLHPHRSLEKSHCTGTQTANSHGLHKGRRDCRVYHPVHNLLRDIPAQGGVAGGVCLAVKVIDQHTTVVTDLIYALIHNQAEKRERVFCIQGLVVEVREENSVHQSGRSQLTPADMRPERCGKPLMGSNHLRIRLVRTDLGANGIIFLNLGRCFLIRNRQQNPLNIKELLLVVLLHHKVHHVRHERHHKEIVPVFIQQLNYGVRISAVQVIHKQHGRKSLHKHLVQGSLGHCFHYTGGSDSALPGLTLIISPRHHIFQETLIDELNLFIVHHPHYRAFRLVEQFGKGYANAVPLEHKRRNVVERVVRCDVCSFEAAGRYGVTGNSILI